MRYPGLLLFSFSMGLIASTVNAARVNPVTSNAPQAQKFSPAEQELIRVQKARMDAAAQRDMAAWSRFVAEDCIFSGDDGSLHTKAEMMAYYKKVPAEYDHAIDPRDYLVHIHGDTAVVNLRATDHEPFGTVDVTSEQRRTETFIKRDGAWLAIAIQWSALPINHRQPVAADSRSYQDYVGQYQSRPKDDLESISIKDGKLWSQTGDDGDWCLPAGGETFFYKSDVGSFTFSRDAQGRVTGYTYHRPDGQETHTMKVK
jgi:hypothetical protein